MYENFNFILLKNDILLVLIFLWTCHNLIFLYFKNCFLLWSECILTISSNLNLSFEIIFTSLTQIAISIIQVICFHILLYILRTNFFASFKFYWNHVDSVSNLSLFICSIINQVCCIKFFFFNVWFVFKKCFNLWKFFGSVSIIIVVAL